MSLANQFCWLLEYIRVNAPELKSRHLADSAGQVLVIGQVPGRTLLSLPDVRIPLFHANCEQLTVEKSRERAVSVEEAQAVF